MPTDSTLWYNPKCSTCRNALQALREKGVEPELRLYLEQAPTLSELQELSRKLGQRPIQFVRRKEEAYARLKLSEDTPDEEVLAAIVDNPVLLERPILVMGPRAVVGRPFERVLELL